MEEGVKKSRFSTNISPYLENYTTQGIVTMEGQGMRLMVLFPITLSDLYPDAEYLRNGTICSHSYKLQWSTIRTYTRQAYSMVSFRMTC